MLSERRWPWLIAAAVTACAPLAPHERVPPPEVAGRSACVRISDVQDFRVVDRRRVLVFAPGRTQAYLLRIAPSVSGAAAGSSVLRLEGRSNRVCGYAGDALYFGSFDERRYSITDVQRLDETAVATLLAEADPETGPLQPAGSEAASIEPLQSDGTGDDNDTTNEEVSP